MKNFLIDKSDPVVIELFRRIEKVVKELDKLEMPTRRTFNGQCFLTDSELSDILKISRRTLQAYRESGRLPYYQLDGKILYKESDVQRALDSFYRKGFDWE